MALIADMVIPSLAFLCALCATELVRKFVIRIGIVDTPLARSSHTIPTPRGGGLAIIVAFFLAISGLCILRVLDGITFSVLLIGGGAVGLIGFLDDKLSVAAPIRFLVHLGAASLAVMMLSGEQFPAFTDWGVPAQWFGRVAMILGMSWAINLYNFMDGIDGLAATEAVFIAGAAGAISLYFAGQGGSAAAWFCLSAASLGFLAWNWPPARIFMGDAGSGFLGFTLATLGLSSSHGENIPLVVWPILSGVFLVDASVTLARRMIRGDKWLQAHRMHAYQHLSRRRLGHKGVTLLATGINVCWLLPWAWYATANKSQGIFAMTTALLPLVGVALWAGAGKSEAKM